MKKIFKSKRWIALFLAFLLIATTCINSSDAFLWATGENESDAGETIESGPVEEIVEMNVEESDDESEPEEVTEEENGGAESEEPDVDQADADNTEQNPDIDPDQMLDEDAEQVPEGEETPEELPEIVEEEVKYSYAISYYYDDKEDKDAGIFGDDGVLGDVIFAFGSVEREVVHNGKNYVLDRIENENGVVTEEAEKNIVKVYYISVKTEKPNQTLTARAEDGATVKVSAPEGALPEGAKVTISVVKDRDVLKKFEDAAKARGTEDNERKIYDITIWDADGNEVQPDKSVTVTISNTGLEGDGATIYHADDENAPVKKVAETGDANRAEFETKHFSLWEIEAQSEESNGFETTIELTVGEKVTLDKHMMKYVSLDETGYQWQVDQDQKLPTIHIVSESTEPPVMEIEGLRAGEVTVTATNGTKTVRYHIIVKLSTVTNPVYVYVKLDGMLGNQDVLSSETIDKLNAIGLRVNDHGWCTVGVLNGAQIDTPMPGEEGIKEENYSQMLTKEIEDAIIDQVRSGKVEMLDSYKLDLNQVDWDEKAAKGEKFGLLVSNGADDYVKDINVWHLNGYLDVKEISYTIKYVDKDSGKEIEKPETKTVPGTKIGTQVTVDKKNIDGYNYVNSDPKNETLTLGPNNNVITLYYEKQASKVKVSKYADKQTAKAGDTITYTIEVENTTSGRDLSGVIIKDVMTNTSGDIDNVKGAVMEYDKDSKAATFHIANIPQAAAGQNNSVKITYVYEVKEEDMGETLVNVVTVGNSDIEVENGSEVKVEIPVETAVLTVNAGSFTGTYNGEDQAVENFFAEKEVNIPNTELKGIPVKVGDKEYYVNGVTAQVVSDKGAVGAKDAGTYINKITVLSDVKVFDENGDDVTRRFTVKGEDGSFVIDKKKLTLRSASLEKEYDGEILKNEHAGNPEVSIADEGFEDKKVNDNGLLVEDGWVDGEGASYEFLGSVLDPGDFQENKFEITSLKEGTSLDNYDITYQFGVLSITNRSAKYEVELLTNSDNVVYDGKEHKVGGFAGAVEDGKLTPIDAQKRTIEIKRNGKTYFVDVNGMTAAGSGITVTDYPEGFGGYPVLVTDGKAVVKDENGKDVSSQFDIKVTYGLLTINEREITVTAGSASYKYTGEEFKASKFDKPAEITEGTIVDGQTYGAEVSGSQTLVGKSETKVEDIKIFDKDGKDVTGNYKITLNPGELIVTDGTPDDEVDDKLVVNKRADKATGYEVGDVVKFTISIKNIFDEEKTVTIRELEGVEFDKLEDDATGLAKFINTVRNVLSSDKQKVVTIPAGETKDITVFYRITEKDILAGEFINKVTIELNDKKYDAESKVETEEPNGHLTVKKTVSSVKDVNGNPTVKPDLGGTIEYTIEVKNDGNLAMEDVVLKDWLANVEYTDLDGGKLNQDNTVSLGTLGINGHKKLVAVYTVTELDIINGSVLNRATVTGKSPDGKEPEFEDRVTTETEKPKGYIRLFKEVVDPKDEYALGAEITYEIKAMNDGNVTVINLEVEDELTGNTISNNSQLKYDKIEPGETVSLGKVSYTVTATDIASGESKLKNIAVGEGKTGIIDPETKEEVPVTVIPGEAEVVIEKDKPSLSITKTSDKTSDVKVGDVIHYTITVINNGNVTINNVMAEDALTGKVGENALIYNGTLEPGEVKTFTETYDVTEKDILAGKVVNTATVKGDNPTPGGENPEDEATVEIPAEKLSVKYAVGKYIPNQQAVYKVGETISYVVYVKNLGNVTLSDIEVEDWLGGDTKNVTFTTLGGIPVNNVDALREAGIALDSNNVVKIDTLAPNEEIAMNCTYTVTRADAGGKVANTAVAKVGPVRPTGPGENPDPIYPDNATTPEVTADVEGIYNLTIHYVYAGGATAAADYTGQYLEGEAYNIGSPTISGYNNTAAFVAGEMPGKDVVVTVTYYAPATPGGGGGGGDDTPDTPEPPTPPVTPTPPVVPIIPEPVPEGVVPVVIPVPADTALAEVGDEAVPLGALIDVDDDGNVTVTPITEEEVPLAGGRTDDHKCCILHFLLMLAALIIYTWFTHSMKKRQEKLAELKDQLAEETLKRQLGITDDKQAEM